MNWYRSHSSLLDSITVSNLHGQEFDYLEYFAGAGEITKHMLASKYRAVRLDLLDFTPEPPKTSNYMDLNQSAGYAFLWMIRLPCFFVVTFRFKKQWHIEFGKQIHSFRSNPFICSWLFLAYPLCPATASSLRLGIIVMLKAMEGAFASHFAIKCSSFCRVNVGTSMRSACCAFGCFAYSSVHEANKLLERKPSSISFQIWKRSVAKVGFNIFGFFIYPNPWTLVQDLNW